MPLQVIRIVEEEFEERIASIPDQHCARAQLRTLLDSIIARVKAEWEPRGSTIVPIDRAGKIIIADGPCKFCGKHQENCNGSGMDDGIQAHDFTPGG